MPLLLGPKGLPLSSSGVDTIGPGTGRGYRLVLTEYAEVTFPGARTLHMLPGEYAILTIDDLNAMTGGIAPSAGDVS